MKTRYIFTALATASLVAGGQAIAQGRGGGHGGGHGGGGAGVGASARGGLGGGLDRMRVDSDVRVGTQTGTRVGRDFGIETRTQARARSQGRAHASDRGIERSNENSVLHDSEIIAPELTGLTTGLTVRNSAGTNLGTVRRIIRSDDGTIRSILVAGADGQRRTIQLRPGTLTLSGGIVTTTDVRVND
jgi:hypothetical protein